MQTSESFRLSAILSFSGGLQDAYTYNMRGHVFANAQTGNIVLMSQNLMSGHLSAGIRYLLPLISFAAGTFLAERLEHRFKNNMAIHWRQVILLVEVIILFFVGLIPDNYNMIANMMVSFSCAMQLQSFRKVRGYGYSSTMCIGNLRNGTVSLSQYIRNKEKASLLKALNYFGIIIAFGTGAGLGGVLTNYLDVRTIWISPILLSFVSMLMIRETNSFSLKKHIMYVRGV